MIEVEIICNELKEISFWGYGFIDRFDVKDYITGFGSPQWKKTHEAAEKTAVVVTSLLKNGATCVGKTIMDEMGFGYFSYFNFLQFISP